MTMESRHVIVECELKGCVVDLTDGGHLFYVNSRRICEDCYNELQAVCDGCKREGLKLVEMVDGSKYCSECQNNNSWEKITA